MHKQSKATQEEADEMESRIRALCQPMRLELSLAPAP
jgi:hypothetical protein